MKKILLLTITAFLTMNVWGQEVNLDLLNFNSGATRYVFGPGDSNPLVLRNSVNSYIGLYGGIGSSDGAYVGIYGKDAINIGNEYNGQLSLVSNTQGSHSYAGLINFSQYDGTTWNKRYRIFKNGDQHWYTGASIERMTLLDNGNLGIGTTNPTKKLNASNGINQEVTFRLGENNVTDFISATNGSLTINADVGGSDGKMYLNARNQNHITLDGTGKVGIGTISPEAMLHISSGNIGIKSQYAYGIFEAIDAQLDITSSSDGTWGSTINFIEGNGASNTDVWSISRQTTNGSGNSSLRINYGTANYHINPNVITFNANGNVGIGTTSPSAGFDVFMSTNDYWTAKIKNDGGSSKGLLLEVGYGGSSASTIMQLNDANGNIRTVFKSNGNVGIGTTNPIYKLAVKGTIGCGEVIVEDVTGWADFVFEDDYNLMSLKELDQFIQVNKHLPEIPTIAEVQENGISVGEMNAKLLQKIEELTLYVIEQNKEMEKFKDELSQLKIENENLKSKFLDINE